ncbi:MAG TPA: ABC transporter substrate-binding protein [Candidatus Limnocylindrales bacterium]|nr:ABC transporter substrate-binding protein [Candidatus Limnocylindrales bacterium]
MESNAFARSRGRLLVLFSAAAIAIGACSSSGASSAPSTAATAPASAPASAEASASAGASASAAAVVLPAPEKKTLKIGLSTGGEASQYAEYLADQLDYYKTIGGFDDVEVSSLQGDAKVVQAITAGGLDMGVLGVSGAINSSTTDTPIKIVSINGVTLTDMLVCGPDIKTAADIKGKQIAISSFGSTAHGSTLLLLDTLGLTDKDVTLTQVGNQDARLAAVKAGSVACAPIDLAQKEAITAAGLNAVTDNKSSGKQWGRSGLGATSDFISKNPNTVLAVVASVLAAQNYMFTNTDDAAAKFADYSQQTPDNAKNVLNDFVTWGNRSMDWTDEAFNNPKKVLAAVNPQMADVDVTKSYDHSFLQKLAQLGFYAQIGDPDLPAQ